MSFLFFLGGRDGRGRGCGFRDCMFHFGFLSFVMDVMFFWEWKGRGEKKRERNSREMKSDDLRWFAWNLAPSLHLLPSFLFPNGDRIILAWNSVRANERKKRHESRDSVVDSLFVSLYSPLSSSSSVLETHLFIFYTMIRCGLCVVSIYDINVGRSNSSYRNGSASKRGIEYKLRDDGWYENLCDFEDRLSFGTEKERERARAGRGRDRSGEVMGSGL